MGGRNETDFSTYMVRHLLMVVFCSALVFFSVFMLLIAYFTHPIGDPTKTPTNCLWAFLITLLFLLPMGGVPIAWALRIRRQRSNGNRTDAAKLAERCRRRYRRLKIVFVLLLLVTLYLGINVPSWIAYQKRVMDSDAMSSLKALAGLQERYHAVNKRYANRKEELTGWRGDPQIVLTIVAADETCWKATARHVESVTVFAYDPCGGGLEKSGGPPLK